MKKLSVIISASLLAANSIYAAPCELRTIAEQSNWQRTGRYSEVEALTKCFEKTYPARVKRLDYGRTPEGRPMLALVVGEKNSFSLKNLPRAKRPVIYIQGGIHAGEIDGKDAGFWFLRDLLDGKFLPGALKKFVFVFVPVFNVDGHERFGAHNRPNQRGPEEMGWRTTAQNYNLNRDYIKADTPEMKASLKLLTEWDPILFADLHVTDGADFQVEVSTIFMPKDKGPAALVKAGSALSENVSKRLSLAGDIPFSVYPAFKKDDEPLLGISNDVTEPRLAHGYWSLHNRLAVLVETHSWKDYARRVKVTRDTLVAMTEEALANSDEWVRAAREGDAESSKVGGQNVTLTWRAGGEKSRTIEFPGYAYKRVKSPISGREETIYDSSTKETWKIPFFYELEPELSIRAPAGYVVPRAWADFFAKKLQVHGIKMRTLKSPKYAELEVFHANTIAWAKESDEGHVALTLRGEWTHEKRQLAPGDLWIGLDQPLSQVVMQMLEPECAESIVAWGMLTTPFEKKEYMENYVADKLGREMLEKNPEVKKEFEKKLRDDKAFAADPAARMEFFYRKHPSWDKTYATYPVVRVLK